MGFELGHAPTPGGGRPKGSVSKYTRTMIDRLEELGCDTVEITARIAMGDAVGLKMMSAEERALPGVTQDGVIVQESGETRAANLIPIEMRLKAATELLNYIAPKRKAIEITGEVSHVLPTLPIPAIAPPA